MAQAPRNPGHTNLNTFGRAHRDEPHYGHLTVRLYPKRGKLRADSLADWCAKRYLESKSKTGKAHYRIHTYKHADSKRYVDRVFFRALTEEDRAELNLLFGHFVVEKVVRTGCLRRPKLKGDERKALDSVIEAFYADIRKRRNERIEETGKAY
jgi:hypothetical protein